MIPTIKYYLLFTPLTWMVPILWVTLPGNGWRVRAATFAFGGAYWAYWEMHDWPFTANSCIYPELRLDEGVPQMTIPPCARCKQSGILHTVAAIFGIYIHDSL